MATIEELTAKVAGLEQQMAAITTPPTEYYTSAYGGEEIDAAVKKVSEGLAGGVTSFNGRTGAVMPQSGDYNATQIPVSGEPKAETVAAALSNKAPAGFGFGDAVQSIETTSAEESYETYCAKVDAVLDGMPDKTAKLVLAYPPAVYGKAGTTISLLYKGDANYAVLSNIGSADMALCGWRMIRLKKSSSEPSAWQPFEWEHPPMQLGVEYRTTDRYNGKLVYAKLLDIGAAVNEAVIEAVDSSKRIIKISPGKGNLSIFPVVNYDSEPALGEYDAAIASDGRNIKIFAGSKTASGAGNQISVEVFYIDA